MTVPKGDKGTTEPGYVKQTQRVVRATSKSGTDSKAVLDVIECPIASTARTARISGSGSARLTEVDTWACYAASPSTARIGVESTHAGGGRGWGL